MVVHSRQLASFFGRRGWLIVLLAWMCPLHALEWQDSAAVRQLFEQAGVRGTFVLYDVAVQRLTGHDEQRARQRFVPASTFKVANTLVGLSTAAVADVDEVLPYGGQPQPVKAWEQDMSLRRAITVSNLPVYQSLARRIGAPRMQEALTRLDYGNADTGSTVDAFWLVGPLRISAVEQVEFLARLAQQQLPFRADHQATVAEIIRLEQRDGRVLHGKTGWAGFPNPGVGWWVGWVSQGERVWVFALNIDITTPADAPRRIDLGRASLKALGVW
jgi:beta-lactamase class D